MNFPNIVTMKKITTILIGILLSAAVFAQNKVVYGQVTVYQNYPVKNVEIKAKKSKATITTDSLGQFSIVCHEKDVIQIKTKTFQSATRRVDPDTDSLYINLLFIDNKVNRQRAVGYGYINEEDLLYAVNNLTDENNDFCSYSNIFDLIRGRFSGVTISNNSVLIRGGNNSFTEGASVALYVVDGQTTSSIDWISPCQIKSIDFLKDSNAAIYGTRGGNGVVVIQMKN